ncbi:MAG: aminopeptidase [Bacteroidetes bacterium]|nr:MAG: aminopeptidase [Bacteroidota bacterium]
MVENRENVFGAVSPKHSHKSQENAKLLNWKYMRHIWFIEILIFITVFSLDPSQAQELDPVLKKLSQEYHFTYKKMTTDTFFTEKYLLEIEQPLDHNNLDGKTFTQQVFLSHNGIDNPVVFITEGYAADYAENSRYLHELSPILNANQVCVEHRYFGESVPDPLDWSKLTVSNSATDHHRIVEILKKIYHGKWLSTGISKGGQTSMFYRCFYPGDVDVSVPYVAPLNFSIEDKRAYHFLNTVGDSVCRSQVLGFQLELLRNKDIYLPAFEKLATKKNLHYRMGVEKGFELSVFEYSFSFWQWGTINCDMIPSNGTPYQMIKHLDRVASIDWVSDKGISAYQAFFYQALAEIGFYGYDITPFKEYVSFNKNPTFDFTAPEGLDVEYDPVVMQEVDCFIRHKAENMLFIYGENDPWSSTAVDLSYSNNCLKVVKRGGSHVTRIGNLPDEQKELVIGTLRKWMGLENDF